MNEIVWQKKSDEIIWIEPMPTGWKMMRFEMCSPKVALETQHIHMASSGRIMSNPIQFSSCHYIVDMAPLWIVSHLA